MLDEDEDYPEDGRCRRCCLDCAGRFSRFLAYMEDNSMSDFTLLFKYKGSVIPKAFVFALPASLVAVLLHHIMKAYDLELDADGGSDIWSNFNFVLGVLIVFRTNQAYARYWEGATLLLQVRGEWFNATSSLVAFCSTKTDKDTRKRVHNFQQHIVRLISMLYCAGLQQIALIPDDKMEIIDIEGLDSEGMNYLMRGVDRCEIVLQWIQRLIVKNMETGVVTAPAPILSRVFQELSRGMVNVKNVQKIAEIPFPFPYTQMIMVMLVIMTLMTPVMASAMSETAWWAGLLTFITVLSFWCMNFIASEIEQPFGEDYNDLPIPDMLRDMNRSLRVLLRSETQTCPTFVLPDHLQGRTATTSTCLNANFIMPNKDLVAGFQKSRGRTVNKINHMVLNLNSEDSHGRHSQHPRVSRVSRAQRRSSWGVPDDDLTFETQREESGSPPASDAGSSPRGKSKPDFQKGGKSGSRLQFPTSVSFSDLSGPVGAGHSTNSGENFQFPEVLAEGEEAPEGGGEAPKVPVRLPGIQSNNPPQSAGAKQGRPPPTRKQDATLAGDDIVIRKALPHIGRPQMIAENRDQNVVATEDVAHYSEI